MMLYCNDENFACLHYRLLDCLERGLNVEARTILQEINFNELTDTSGLTLLHYSVKYGNVEMSQYLIDEGYNVNAQEGSGHTPLMMAVKARDVRIVDIMIKNDADIYLVNVDGKCSLELAFESHLCSSEQANSLIILGMLSDKANNDFSKGTSMQFLLNLSDVGKLVIGVFGNVAITRFILENGYSIDFQLPHKGFTALHCAIRFSRFENAKILIEYRANVNILDMYGRSPLHYYTANFEDVDRDSEILKNLLKYSTRLYTPDRRSITETQRLLLVGKKKTVRTVLLSDFDVNTCFKNDKSLLFLLIENSNDDVYNLLDELNINFDVNKCDQDDRTALMEAALNGSPEKVEFLLEHGADVNMLSKTGSCALLNALTRYLCSKRNPEKENGRIKVVELLLQYGVDAQSFFGNTQNCINSHSASIRLIVAHLAMLGALDWSFLTEASRRRIKLEPSFEAYFNLCTQQLEEMKTFKVHGTVTLFKLLTDRKETIVTYARIEEFISAWNGIIANIIHLEPYYLNTLQRNVSKVLYNISKVALAIKALTGPVR